MWMLRLIKGSMPLLLHPWAMLLGPPLLLRHAALRLYDMQRSTAMLSLLCRGLLSGDSCTRVRGWWAWMPDWICAELQPRQGRLRLQAMLQWRAGAALLLYQCILRVLSSRGLMDRGGLDVLWGREGLRSPGPEILLILHQPW
jgi:hypothetical protein